MRFSLRLTGSSISQSYIFGIIVPDKAVTMKWASENGSSKTFPELCEDEVCLIANVLILIFLWRVNHSYSFSVLSTSPIPPSVSSYKETSPTVTLKNAFFQCLVPSSVVVFKSGLMTILFLISINSFDGRIIALT